jgi:hypothetical protein
MTAAHIYAPSFNGFPAGGKRRIFSKIAGRLAPARKIYAGFSP